jgi:hypothetical protein
MPSSTASIAAWFARYADFLRLPVIRTRIVLLLVACGAVERGVYNLFRHYSRAGGEAYLVAQAIGEGRGFADAYGPGHGPTAHLLPISPGIAGGVYELFGVSSPSAELVLATWSIGLALGSYLLLDRAFARLGVSSLARLAALGFLCLAPTYIAQESVDFRVWEGGLAVFVSALFLDRLLALRDERAPFRDRAFLAIIAPVLFFISPLLGLAAVMSLCVYWLRQRDPTGFVISFTVSGIVLAALVVPWALRNERVLGHFVPLRSNAGLELAIGQHPEALADRPGDEILMARLVAIHPLQSREAFYAMKAAGGEIPYAHARGIEAQRWVAAHPVQSARLMLTHLRQALIPSPWMFRIWGNLPLAPIQAALAILVGVLGLSGLGERLMRGDRRWLYVVLLVGVPALLFSPFQPVMRYSYLDYALLVFSAAAGLDALSRRLWAVDAVTSRV